ncbi:MAG: oligosaccharide flippase family protein [Bacteroidales bacterium]|nr:oligosaccharide flippase family protein [Bacteroidales bacterium]
MGVIIRQSIKGTIVNYVGIAIGFITTFFVLTRCLTAEEIGLTRVLVDAATLFAGLAQLGTNASVMRFYPYFKDKKSKDHGFFFWSLVVPFIGFTIYSIIFLSLKVPISTAFAKNSQLFVDYYYFVFPLAFFMLYMAVFETNSNVLMRIAVPKFIREVGIRVMLLVVYLLYSYDVLSITGFIFSFSIVYGIATLLNILYLFSLKRISYKPDFKFITKPLRKDYLNYTVFLIAAALGSAIAPSINTLFVTAKMGLVYTGVFTIATYVATVVEIPYRSLGTISQPQISQAVKDNDIVTVNKLCKGVSLHQFLAGFFIFFIVWINIDLFFDLLPNGQEYASAKWVVFILGMTRLFNSSFSVGTSVLSYSKYYYTSLGFSFLLTFLAIFFNVKLIPVWGINGAAFATLFSYIIYYLLLLGLVKWKMKTSPFSMGQFKVVLIICLLFALNWLWTILLTPVLHSIQFSEFACNIIDAVLRTGIFSIIGIVIIYYWRVSDEVNGLIKKVLKKS